MPLKMKSVSGSLAESEPVRCYTEIEHGKSILLTQTNGAIDGFPLTWLYRWQWNEETTGEQIVITLTEHEILIQGKNLETITALLTKGTGFHLRMIDERYQTMLSPNATLITQLTVKPLSKSSVN
mgnify:CR=1 FL=1